MRQNGHGTITFEDARTWIEETGLCLFLPRRQFASSVAPSFVEAVAGQRNATPDPKHIALAEELLVRLERDGVVVRLNLQGQPGEQPDFVVAAWVLPYVYALRGDRDWRRSPQLTGSRQVSPLAVQVYKILEVTETNVAELKHTIGREVTEAAVIRGITELWQQLRIIPMIAAPGESAKWQLLRVRFQRAIAEGASTSQVTAISVLASIYLQAVISATMEDVEVFLSPLTARSKVREVLRGLVATRQVHTIALGHAPHFYVAGTLPEFSVTPTFYTSSSMSSSSSFFLHAGGREVEPEEPIFAEPAPKKELPAPALQTEDTAVVVDAGLAELPSEAVIPVLAAQAEPIVAAKTASVAAAPVAADPVKHAPRVVSQHKSAPAEKAPAHNRFSRPASHTHSSKPAASGSRPPHRKDDARGTGRPAASHGSSSRPASSRPGSSRPVSSRPGSDRPGTSRPGSSRPAASRTDRPGSGRPSSARPAGGTRSAATRPAGASSRPASVHGRTAPAGKSKPAAGHSTVGKRTAPGGKPAARPAKPGVGARGPQSSARPQRPGARPAASAGARPAGKSAAGARKSGPARPGTPVRKPAGAAKSSAGKRASFAGSRKRG